MKVKFTKITAGLYECKGKKYTWIIENVGNEWHVGPEHDSHADQYNTLKDAKASTVAHFEQAERNGWSY